MENSDDRAAKRAKELLPCLRPNDVCEPDDADFRKCWNCFHRVAVAAELREAYAEIEKWHSRAQGQSDIADHVGMENSDLKAEIAGLKEKLNQKDDEYEQQCKHAEAEIASLRTELQHWREAAASVGQPDGHGWAEETKSLRAKLAARDKE